MHGPTWIFSVNLTAFSLQDHARTRAVLLSPGGTAFLISMFEQWVTVLLGL
jgi:hypothetical protein